MAQERRLFVQDLDTKKTVVQIVDTKSRLQTKTGDQF